MSGAPYLHQLEVLVENVRDILGSDDPKVRLGAIRHLAEGVEHIERCVVTEAHESGLSWADIGREYGVTRQSAHKRFAGLPVASADVFAWLESDTVHAPADALVDAARRRRDIVKTVGDVHPGSPS